MMISAGGTTWTVIVRGLLAQRRPAAEACLLYEETAASQLQRAQAQALKSAPVPGSSLPF
jgi:ribosome-associated heat shock protein Hsp15